MKHYAAIAAERPVAGARRYIRKGILTMLFLIFLGCATTSPKPVTIKHQEETYQGSTAASREQYQKEAADGSASALVDLLKKKNVISADEAALFTKHYGAKAAGEKGAAAASEGVAALAELLKRKNVISADEAGRFVKQYGPPAAGEKIAALASETDGKELMERITTNVTQELKKSLREQVKSQIHEEVAREITKSDKERIEKITANVTQELIKVLPEQIKSQVQKEVPREVTKSDKERIEKITASVTEELKKDLPKQIKIHVREEIPGEIAKSNREQIEKITASITEELKKGLPEEVKIHVREEVPREIRKVDMSAVVPEWTKRIRFGGDVRLRYESDRFDKRNADLAKPDAPTQLMNTKIDQDRFKYRVRVGATAQVNEKTEAVIRLSTGNDTNPISTNSTMGDSMNRDRVYFDAAYLKWKPWKFLTFEGGRMPNPWFSSDLVWSNSLNFEGFALNVNTPVTETLTPFLTVGAFPLQQYDFSQQGKWLTAGQLGLEMKRQKGVSAKIGAAYYNFRNITGVANDPLNAGLTDWTAPLYQQKGNTLFDIGTGGTIKTAYASEFKEFNITGNLDIGFWDPVHIVFLGDYVKNRGFNRLDVAQRTGNPNPKEYTEGYQIGMSVGYPTIQEFGQWKVYLSYKYLGADAVVDAYTDSDFHLGGTNAKGWIFGVDLGLAKNLWLSARWLTADEISGPPLAIDVLQVDLNTRF